MGIRLYLLWRCEFFIFSYNLFFILLYFSYEIRVPIFERLRRFFLKLQHVLWEFGCTFSGGASFSYFSLIPFSFYCILATKYACQFSKGCAGFFSSYNMFSGNSAVPSLEVRVFLNSFFILLYFIYEICVPIFERLRRFFLKLQHV